MLDSLRTIGTFPLFLLTAIAAWSCRTHQPGADLQETPDLIETANLKLLHQNAAKAAQQGNFSSAAASFSEANQVALKLHKPALAARYLGNLGALEIYRQQYRSARATLLQARDASKQARDHAGSGMASANLSSLNIRTGDMDSALANAKHGLRDIGGEANLPGTREQLISNIGTVLASQGKLIEAEAAFDQALDEAAKSGHTALLAQIWDNLGYARLAHQDLQGAEAALLEAYRIQIRHPDPSLSATLALLADLRRLQGDLSSAGTLIQRSLAASGEAIPRWRLYYQHGLILSAKGGHNEALARYRDALALARIWREDIAPTDPLRSSTSTWLNEVVRAYAAELAEDPGFFSVNSRSARDAFEGVEALRSAALRATLLDSPKKKRDLPDEYWQVLSQFRAAQSARLTVGDTRLQTRVHELEQRLNEIEASQYAPRENVPRGSTLAEIQRRLDGRELLLSFYFDHRVSCVWAVTRERFEVHRLGSGDIARNVARFQKALASDAADALAVGSVLHSELLGGIPERTLAKEEWIITADDTAVQIPFAALREQVPGGTSRYVIESHTVRFVPSAFSHVEFPSQEPSAGGFLGVGDGVYNQADPRRQQVASNGFDTVEAAPVQLPRLVGSGQELQACAREWRGASTLLTGEKATRRDLILAVAARPAVIHLATHLLEPSGPQDAVISLGLGPDSAPELLTSYDVASLRVPGSVVVMSGCSSAAAGASEGVGPLGLARAWLIAGARCVVGSRWPVSDDSGELFLAFYRHIKTGSAEPQALQKAQVEMIRSGTWRSKPMYWASFFEIARSK